ncbi:MAG: peptide deformylase [Acidimicrobiales bacterium]|nr:peptide deformylase [Acidimicrobiales bacterium]RZV48743.1 MAG: peptide deformylase [Acidimicrobiales bacterium]
MRRSLRLRNHEPTVPLDPVSAPYRIRTYGDPVLKQVAKEITDIDGALVQLAEDMLETMYAEPGLGLAAPQVGVRKRLFVYDLEMGEEPHALINPEIVESDGEWEFDEGCLSVPGLSWNIVRPKQIHIVGRDLDGNEVSIEADELEARLFQHELDHLNGVLLVEHLDAEQLREAKKILRQRAEVGDPSADKLRAELGLSSPGSSGLSLS